jgi:hypothetical protein
MQQITIGRALCAVAMTSIILVLQGQTPPPSAPSPTPPAAESTPALVSPAAAPARAPAPPVAAAAPVPTPAPLPAASQGVGLWDEFWKAAVQELPKLITTLFAAILAWVVGSRITAAWDMRKKRGEFDILLAKEFYTLVASFKAVAREWEAYLKRKPASDNLAAWETARIELARRALEAETNMESILLKLLTEGMGREGLTEAERTQRQRSLSLFRVAFRNLRETVEEGQDPPPGWGDPQFWLFNRLAGEISRMVHERSVQVPDKARTPSQAMNAADYLRLLVGRTTDLRAAAAGLQPRVEAFFRQRAEDRAAARRANVERLLETGQFAFVEVLPLRPAEGQPPPPLPSVPTLDPAGRAAVEVMGERRDPTRARVVANALFGANAALHHYVVLCNEPARVLVVERDRDPKIFDELKKLEVQLPWLNEPVKAADLLRWQLSPNGHARLAEIATEEL